MTQVDEIASLPLAFRNIQFVPSTILRMELIRTINDINQMIKDTEAFTPEPELVTITNRFFSYLTNSCVDKATITRRAFWIMTQATIVRGRMVEFLHRNTTHSIEDYTHVLYADMIDMIATMSEKLAEYVQRYPTKDDYNITEVMDAIVEMASKTKSCQRETYYTTLKTYGDRIIQRLDHGIKQNEIGVQMQRNLLHSDLNQFFHRLRAYRSRVTVS